MTFLKSEITDCREEVADRLEAAILRRKGLPARLTHGRCLGTWTSGISHHSLIRVVYCTHNAFYVEHTLSFWEPGILVRVRERIAYVTSPSIKALGMESVRSFPGRQHSLLLEELSVSCVRLLGGDSWNLGLVTSGLCLHASALC